MTSQIQRTRIIDHDDKIKVLELGVGMSHLEYLLKLSMMAKGI